MYKLKGEKSNGAYTSIKNNVLSKNFTFEAE